MTLALEDMMPQHGPCHTGPATGMQTANVKLGQALSVYMWFILMVKKLCAHLCDLFLWVHLNMVVAAETATAGFAVVMASLSLQGEPNQTGAKGCCNSVIEAD